LLWILVMTLAIPSFDNRLSGGTQNALFKAYGHPLLGELVPALWGELASAGRVGLYDPSGHAALVDLYYPLAKLITGPRFVQRLEEVGQQVLGQPAIAITQLADAAVASSMDTLLIASFDAPRLAAQLAPYLPPHLKVIGFDRLRLPTSMLSRPDDYLNVLNFSTNFGFMRAITDTAGRRRYTRIQVGNYWGGYGASDAAMWLRLYDEGGQELASWEESLGAPGQMLVLDSQEIQKRFQLPDFTGSLFMHAVRIAGHDVIKYVVDDYGDAPEVLSVTHDANSWPADLYAGLPQLQADERVVLWLQNSHPIPIPAGEIALNRMGRNSTPADSYVFPHAIPGFGTAALVVNDLLPASNHADQLELQAGRYVVRPRYEVIQGAAAGGRSYLSHINVQRTDLKPDPALPRLAGDLGKGYILAMPIMPLNAFETTALPTPMATCQQALCLQALIYDADGELVLQKPLGRIGRDQTQLLHINSWLQESGKVLPSGYGHLELIYDFTANDNGDNDADGWLHAVARYQHRRSGHQADTSFGAHVFNLPATYRGQPFSYKGNPPGLSTRLYLRVGAAGVEAGEMGDGTRLFCQLIYPASKPWVDHSTTQLLLHNGLGEQVATANLSIPCSGSTLWYYDEQFSLAQRQAAGRHGYIVVRDTSCRLFGYHGLMAANETAFALDHMFGA
jgi:hypothetical protein